MKKTSLLITLLTLLFIGAIKAQKLPLVNPIHETATKVFQYNTGQAELQGEYRKSAHMSMYETQSPETDCQEIWIGDTFYDSQTNAAGQRRVDVSNEGNISIVWTCHGNTTNINFPNRGTGYVSGLTPTGLDFFPVQKLEESLRTGWPNITQLTDGREFVVNHAPLGNNQDFLHTLWRNTNDDNWTEVAIPSAIPHGLLWPRLASGGNTVHVIALTTPTQNMGTVYEGQDGALLYFRSNDGGENWDIKDYLIPEIDSSYLVNVETDSYFIDADENGNVAIAIFNTWSDILLLKSDNNGEPGSWSKRIVYDFPLEKYRINDLYTLEDIGGVDPNGPGALEGASETDMFAIFASDGAGSLTLDSEGNAHVVFPHMFVSDIDPDDAGWVFYPFTSGISYWNELMEDGGHQAIPQVDIYYDENQNGVLDFQAQGGNYGLGGTSMPSLSITDDGILFLAYTNLMESFSRFNATSNDTLQHYRHIYLTVSRDGGANWAVPYDLINEDIILFPALLDQTEAIYPHTDFLKDHTMLVSYQFDDEPGLNLTMSEGDPINNNTVALVKIEIDEVFPTTSSKTITSSSFNFQMFPNPTSSNVFLQFDLEETKSVQIEISNMLGQEIERKDLGRIPGGNHNIPVSIAGIPSGIYLVSLATSTKKGTNKLIIR